MVVVWPFDIPLLFRDGRAQHLTGLCLLKDICRGHLDGGQVGSKEITFYPDVVRSGDYMADAKTAGSVCLVIQLVLPCALFGDGPISLRLLGGTDAAMAPPIDFFKLVFEPVASKFGVHFDCQLKRRGFYPKGGGEVSLTINPIKSLEPVILLERGNVLRVTGCAYVAGVLPFKVARIMAQAARETIQHSYRQLPVNIEAIKEEQHRAMATGSGILIIAETSTGCFLSGSAIGSRGVPAEEVGAKAGQMLVDNLNHGGCVDDYLQDQLVILMALAKGTSKVKCGPITLHTETALQVAKTLTKMEYKITEVSKMEHILEIVGIGLDNKTLS
ncbi:hypothetical protein LSH36_476g02054 [Paralvinella palmiformis]|uniref:RNA 3'-terminal phosphate cyclase n=1 Tax=Paralvinella palmiformis TaxID=53620 RepID=A0AAD9J9T7_9ANNE|nr:hypothetical protein LSH36_476g02054 [Paralvinella palmiformis]